MAKSFHNAPRQVLRLKSREITATVLLASVAQRMRPTKFVEPPRVKPPVGCVHQWVNREGELVRCGEPPVLHRSGWLCKDHYLDLCGVSPNPEVHSDYTRYRDIDREVIDALKALENLKIGWARQCNETYPVVASGYTIEMMENPYPPLAGQVLYEPKDDEGSNARHGS